jgi:hypothetical protein
MRVRPPIARGSPNNFARTYDCAKPRGPAGGRAGGYRGAAEKPPAIIDGTGGLDDRLVADFGLVRASGYNS